MRNLFGGAFTPCDLQNGCIDLRFLKLLVALGGYLLRRSDHLDGGLQKGGRNAHSSFMTDINYRKREYSSVMIQGLPFRFCAARPLCPGGKDKVYVCVGVWGCVCMFGLLSLSPSPRPLCKHTLQRAPSCHSRRHTAAKNVTVRGRGGWWVGGRETKRAKRRCGFEAQQSTPFNLVGFHYLF